MEYETIAAVDLGSNSFRLQVGRVVDGQIYPLDSLKETVRLATGLTAEKALDRPSLERGWAALRRFGERLRHVKKGAVRAVATNTLRVARNAEEFLAGGETALGFPIEVIAGREEARLIYLGTIHSLPPASHKRLVIDIGGGSTEFVIGKKEEPLLLDSLYMGCVSYTLRYFPDGKIDKKRLYAAQEAAAKEIELIRHDYLRQGWKEAIGSSGTARAICDLLETNRLNPGNVAGITREGLDKLSALLCKIGAIDAFNAPGSRADRLPVLPGGLAIMRAIFEAFSLSRMTYADGALRLGALYDLLGRFQHQDMRAETVRQFARRYHVERRQTLRVRAAALNLWSQLSGQPLPAEAGAENAETEENALFLDWAACLHEIGISVAHSGYHKHGAYILTYADMPGFSNKDRARLATLVLGHRGNLGKFSATPRNDPVWQLIFCLRLAALLHRSRDDRELPHLRARPLSNGFSLSIPERWLEENPWTAAALSEESGIWRQAGFEFRLDVLSEKKPKE
ncbi:MAG: Ppx/GppA family phosphatase [Zoogloeaceae bacterium]|jgi:exopolyphosphatase/guanosine-5'-triphosphate,3'-diphosphate pyrophosphatase|nr:Ppx/GppA family phosphatase [Zoogloeaceae bacterium]